jgi:uncharacterized protein
MKTEHLRLYIYESQMQEGIPLYEWLLEKAKSLGIQGGTAFRSIAGFGKSQIVHEEHFFELGADLTIEVAFVLPPKQSEFFLAELSKRGIHVFYIRSEVECGYTRDT